MRFSARFPKSNRLLLSDCVSKCNGHIMTNIGDFQSYFMQLKSYDVILYKQVDITPITMSICILYKSVCHDMWWCHSHCHVKGCQKYISNSKQILASSVILPQIRRIYLFVDVPRLYFICLQPQWQLLFLNLTLSIWISHFDI